MATAPRLRVSLQALDSAVGGARGLAAWLAGVAPGQARGEVTVALVSDRRMRALNRMFRGEDSATDVLSFGVVATASRARSRTNDGPLGDIVIATGVAARQAREQGHTVATELRILALHGLLHLLGYDHERDGGAMARVESRLRRKGGLPAAAPARRARGRARARIRR